MFSRGWEGEEREERLNLMAGMMKDVRRYGDGRDYKGQYAQKEKADVYGGAILRLRAGLRDAEEVDEELCDVAKDKHCST